ncbi:hypothetical protein AAHA92_15053 [Salvia divinorum]|uniref:Ubiquitin-like protease family profile domain-containing protein n=1 Tax=Salvia divinorum TaxID=28513 RepID=A0ABD1HHH2_SALDI
MKGVTGKEQETGAEKETGKEAEKEKETVPEKETGKEAEKEKETVQEKEKEIEKEKETEKKDNQEGQHKEEKDKGKNKVADEHDTGRTITKEDKEVMDWLIKNEEIDSFMIIYEDDRLFVYKEDFHTLAPRSYVSTNIIDACASYLNYQEEYRSKASPRRLFISTTPTLFNIPNFKWGNYDIIFFPIFAHGHFYPICFNLKGESVDIIDNSEVLPELLKNKYGHDLEILKKFFIIYLGNGDNFSMGKKNRTCVRGRNRS